MYYQTFLYRLFIFQSLYHVITTAYDYESYPIHTLPLVVVDEELSSMTATPYTPAPVITMAYDKELDDILEWFSQSPPHKLRLQPLFNEIQSTETSYNTKLSALVEFGMNLRYHPSSKVHAVYTRLKSFLQIVVQLHYQSSTFLNQVNKVIQMTNEQDVIPPLLRAFLSLGLRSKVFGSYAARYTKAISILSTQRTTLPPLDTLLFEFEQENHIQGIQAYFIEPIQRLPRYVLLVGEIQKRMKGRSEEEMALALETVQALKTAAEIVNLRARTKTQVVREGVLGIVKSLKSK